MGNFRLTLVINNLGSGGAQRVLTAIANSYVTPEISVYVISIDGTDEDFFELSKDVKHIVLNISGPSISMLKLSGLYMTIKRILVIRKTIRGISPDSVVAFLGQINILVVIATLGLKTRVVISERNDPARQSLGFGWDMLRKWIYRHADIVSANTKGALATMRAYVPEKKLLYIPNPIVQRERNINNKNGKELLAVGSLRYQKAFDVLLNACASVFNKEPEWHLTIVGDGELMHELQTLADNLKVSNHLNWIGRADSNPYYRNAEIFILPSRHEGTPNVLLEAISYGLPIIVSDASPGPLQYVEHEVSGLVVPVEDVGALASAILKLIRSPNLRGELASAAFNRLEGNRIDNVLQVWDRAIAIRQ